MAKHSNKKEAQKVQGLFFQDVLKWLMIGIVLFAGLIANSYYELQVSGAIRAAIGIVLFVALLFGASTTFLGQQAWGFLKLSRNEMRKVVWPTKQETTQTTIMVVVIVLFTAVVLWFLDWFFQWFVYSFLLG